MWVLLCPWIHPYLLLDESVLEVLCEIFYTTLLSLIQKSCIYLKNLCWLREQGCTLTVPLPKLHWGCCSWPLLIKVCHSDFQSYWDLWAWEQSPARKAGCICPYSSWFGNCYKIRKKWSSFKSSKLLELWLPGADEHMKTGELPGR